MKKVNYNVVDQAIYELNQKYGRDSHVEFYASRKKGIIQCELSWWAIGNVTPDEALTFMNTLSHAIADAQDFKYNGYMIDYGEG